MPLLVPCVKCQRQLRVKPDLAGKTVRCPYCDSSVQVPSVGNPDSSPAERAAGERATKTNAPAPSSHADDPADDELPGVVMIPRKLPSRGALGRAFDKVLAVVSQRRRELGVGAAIVIVLLVLQFGWDFGAAHPAPKPQVAAADAPSDAESSPAEPAVGGAQASNSAPGDATSEQSETTEPSEKRVQLQPRATSTESTEATPKMTPAPTRRRSPRPRPPAQSPAQQLSPGPSTDTAAAAGEKPSAEAATQQPAADMHKARSKSAPARPSVAHKGSYTVENPPEVGEIVVVRLKDGLHLAKVASVSLSELHCDVTVIESGPYHKTRTIRETKRTESVRFGQLRAPSPSKSNPPLSPNGAPSA